MYFDVFKRFSIETVDINYGILDYVYVPAILNLE